MAEAAVDEALVAELQQVMSTHLEDAAPGRTADGGLPVQRLTVEEHLFAKRLPQVGQLAVLLDNFVPAGVPQRELAVHDEVDGFYHGVLLEQPIALLDLQYFTLIKYHLVGIERQFSEDWMVIPYLLQLQILRRQLPRIHDGSVLV